MLSKPTVYKPHIKSLPSAICKPSSNVYYGLFTSLVKIFAMYYCKLSKIISICVVQTPIKSIPSAICKHSKVFTFDFFVLA